MKPVENPCGDVDPVTGVTCARPVGHVERDHQYDDKAVRLTWARELTPVEVTAERAPEGGYGEIWAQIEAAAMAGALWL